MKKDVTIGQLVKSKSGRDKDKVFLVVKTDGSHVWLADGSLRKIAKPKKKNVCHVQITHKIAYEIAEKVTNGAVLRDEDIKKCLGELGVDG